ncbi:MAG: TRAP transporter large permease, partial [Bacillota bacterium]
FIGGIVPGMLMGLVMLGIAYVIAVKNGYPRREARVTPREFAKTTWEAIPALLMPLIILGGILGGVFTPTEAAAVAVAYALFVGFFVTKALKLSDLPHALKNAALTASSVLLIIATSKLLGEVLTVNRIPEQVAGLALSRVANKYIFLALTNVILLVAGCLMDISAACIILVPILLPIATFFHISPLFFGIIMCVNLAIGVVTPPMGPTLFVACNIADVSLEKVSRAALPFILGSILTIFALSYAEPLVMWLPRLFGYAG